MSSEHPRPWIDVRDFGAKCDGVTDDTAAFNAAIMAATGPVFRPEGTVKFSGDVEI